MVTKKKLRRELAAARRERDEMKQIVKLCHAYIDGYRADIQAISDDVMKLNKFCQLCNRIIAADKREEDYIGTRSD